MFLLGMVFIIICQPLLEGITNLLLTTMELLRSKLAVGINKNNRIIEMEDDIEEFTINGFRQEEEEE